MEAAPHHSRGRQRSSRTLLLLTLGLTATLAQGAAWTEDFSQPPESRGWKTFGDASLFRWDAAGSALEARWLSSRPNSYFYRKLDFPLRKSDDFSVVFDLEIDSIAGGVNPEKPCGFEIAAGLLNVEQASAPGFRRGSGFQSPNLVEFDYFPAACYDATVATSVVSTNNQFRFGHTFPFELRPGVAWTVALSYTSSNQTFVTTIAEDGGVPTRLKDVALGASFTDFSVDAFSISSYSDEGSPMDSVEALGRVTRVVLITPDPPIAELAGRLLENGAWEISFAGRPSWVYRLERTLDLKEWSAVAGPAAGTGASQTLADESPPGAAAFYRLRAER